MNIHRRSILLTLLLAACSPPATRDITVLVGGQEPLVLRDGDRCAIVLPRVVEYGELGAAVRECFRPTGE